MKKYTMSKDWRQEHGEWKKEQDMFFLPGKRDSKFLWGVIVGLIPSLIYILLNH